MKAHPEKHPRFRVHFTPTSAPGLNLVEILFGIIDKQAIHHGIITSVKDLNAKIRQFTSWNGRKHPLDQDPYQLMAKANGEPTSEPRH